MMEVEENSISNSMEPFKKTVYRSIQISLEDYFNPPELPFYWRLSSLNQVINIKNTEDFFERTKSFIHRENIYLNLILIVLIVVFMMMKFKKILNLIYIFGIKKI